MYIRQYTDCFSHCISSFELHRFNRIPSQLTNDLQYVTNPQFNDDVYSVFDFHSKNVQ